MFDLDKGLQHVTALAVLPSEDNLAALRRIFSHTTWQLLAAESRSGANAILGCEPVSTVIGECTLPDGAWRDLLDDFRGLEVPPRLIVVSRLADEQLWSDALNCGAYDVLPEPFDSREVLRAVKFAWLSWRGQWEQRLGSRVRQAGG